MYSLDTVFDANDRAPPPRWAPAEAEVHRAEGRQLAERLVAELAATGRAHIEVWYQAHGHPAERVAGA